MRAKGPRGCTAWLLIPTNARSISLVPVSSYRCINQHPRLTGRGRRKACPRWHRRLPRRRTGAVIVDGSWARCDDVTGDWIYARISYQEGHWCRHAMIPTSRHQNIA